LSPKKIVTRNSFPQNCGKDFSCEKNNVPFNNFFRKIGFLQICGDDLSFLKCPVRPRSDNAAKTLPPPHLFGAAWHRRLLASRRSRRPLSPTTTSPLAA
jgi:hypothetical protein